MIRTLLGLFCIALIPSHLLGQDPYFFNFNTEHGVPSSEVYEAAFDIHGMPWFATDRGVCRYNGYEFATFTSQDGLSNNTCLEIRTAPNGDIWFVGLDGSLSFLKNGKIHAFAGNKKTREELRQRSLLGGMQWEGNKYMYYWAWGRTKNYFFSYDFETEKLRTVLPEELAKRFHRVVIDKHSFFVLGNSIIPEMRVPNVLLTHDGRIYYDDYVKTGLLKMGEVSNSETFETVWLGATIHDLYLDGRGDLFVSTSEGILRFPNGDLKRKPTHFFPDVSFSSIRQDREENYWLTTLEKGIFLVPSFDFHGVDVPVGNRTSTTVSALVGMNNHLFFGTIEGRIFAVNKQGSVEQLYGSPENFGQLAFGSVIEDRGFIGEVRVLEEEGKAKAIAPKNENGRSIKLELENGQFLQAGLAGYIVMDKIDSRNYELHSDVLPERVHACLQTGNKIYVGCLGGLWVIQNYEFRKPQRVREWGSTRVNDLKTDHYGNLWIASIGDGVACYSKGKISRITVEDGLTSNMVNRIAMGPPGVMWAATNMGLNKIEYEWKDELKVLSISSVNSEDGLPGNFIQDVAYWNGKVWLATHEGLVYFSPGLIENRNLPRIPIFLEKVEVNHHSMDTDTFPKLKFNQNDLAFHFLGMSMRKPRNQDFYRYRLSENGEDEPWEYTNDRTVRYMNLSPGEYTFEVACQNRLGEWSEEMASFHFLIRPHFSNTLWFQGLIAILVLGMVFGFALFRVRRIRQKAEQKRRLQEALLKTQQAEITALRNQMNPHFVFNALNSIQNFIFKNDIRKANHYLGRFSKLMRDGLQFSRLKAISLQEELSFLQAYLELEAMRFPDRFTYQVEVQSGIDQQAVKVPPFLFQPLLENAVKHAFKDIDYPGLLKVSFRQPRLEVLVVEITDNGPGFDFQVASLGQKGHRSMGLEIVANRIALLNAEEDEEKAKFEMTNLASRGGQGMLARFVIPINLKENGESDSH